MKDSIAMEAWNVSPAPAKTLANAPRERLEILKRKVQGEISEVRGYVSQQCQLLELIEAYLATWDQPIRGEMWRAMIEFAETHDCGLTGRAIADFLQYHPPSGASPSQQAGA